MTTTHTPRCALLLGASMAALLTARVLSDHFDHATIVERDPLHDSMPLMTSVASC